ncbi:MAG: transcriptional regulator NrdR [Patescibacteria group bacterium]|jgi:transcriptional repressor NrdR
MKCPACNYHDTKVTDSRTASDGLVIRRRRECLHCGFRFSTYEEVEILNLTVVKQDGRREAYNRAKLEKGLMRSLEKRPMTADDFRKLVNLIERDIQITGKQEIRSAAIGELVMRHLKKADQVAYIRFASVYRSFTDADQFRKALGTLTKKKIKTRGTVSRHVAGRKAKSKR